MKDGVDSDQAEQRLTRLLTLRHGKDFFTRNMDSVLKTAEKPPILFSYFLTLVAVSPLVGRRHRRYEYYAGFRHRANA